MLQSVLCSTNELFMNMGCPRSSHKRIIIQICFVQVKIFRWNPIYEAVLNDPKACRCLALVA